MITAQWCGCLSWCAFPYLVVSFCCMPFSTSLTASELPCRTLFGFAPSTSEVMLSHTPHARYTGPKFVHTVLSDNWCGLDLIAVP